LNFGLSPDFSVQLKVSLSERLSERLSQKLKSPSGGLIAANGRRLCKLCEGTGQLANIIHRVSVTPGNPENLREFV